MRSETEVPTLFSGTQRVSCFVFARADNLRQAKAKARYKTWKAAREAGWNLSFGEIAVRLADYPPVLEGQDAEKGVIW
jgi:hypothetical protein